MRANSLYHYSEYFWRNSHSNCLFGVFTLVTKMLALTFEDHKHFIHTHESHIRKIYKIKKICPKMYFKSHTSLTNGAAGCDEDRLREDVDDTRLHLRQLLTVVVKVNHQRLDDDVAVLCLQSHRCHGNNVG